MGQHVEDQIGAALRKDCQREFDAVRSKRVASQPWRRMLRMTHAGARQCFHIL